MTRSSPARCPCDPTRAYAECCGPLHRGRASRRPTAATAEQLMRSRYSAFAVGDATYLLATWHPSTRPARLDLDGGPEWRGLEILAITAGGADDRTGTVGFAARFWDPHARERGVQREDSAFVRTGGEWFYVGPAAETISATPTTANSSR